MFSKLGYNLVGKQNYLEIISMPVVKVDVEFRSYIEQQLSWVQDGVLEFEVEYRKLNDEEIEQLVQILQHPTENFPEIKEIVLNSHKLGDRAATALATLKIESLILMGNNIGSEGAKSLASSNSLKALMLSYNPLGDLGAVALSKSTSIVTLTAQNCDIGYLGGNALLSSTTIKELDLSVNRVSDDAIPELLPKNIKTLNLSDNLIGIQGAKRLAGSEHIKRLYLNNNKVRSEGAVFLSENKVLKELSLDSNKLDDKCAESLSRMETIDKLGLASNDFSKQACCLLFSSANQNKRKTIDLSCNGFEKRERASSILRPSSNILSE